jgi:hypothetical protein
MKKLIVIAALASGLTAGVTSVSAQTSGGPPACAKDYKDFWDNLDRQKSGKMSANSADLPDRLGLSSVHGGRRTIHGQGLHEKLQSQANAKASDISMAMPRTSRVTQREEMSILLEGSLVGNVVAAPTDIAGIRIVGCATSAWVIECHGNAPSARDHARPLRDFDCPALVVSQPPSVIADRLQSAGRQSDNRSELI